MTLNGAPLSGFTAPLPKIIAQSPTEKPFELGNRPRQTSEWGEQSNKI